MFEETLVKKYTVKPIEKSSVFPAFPLFSGRSGTH
jgi:hypothetical protein